MSLSLSGGVAPGDWVQVIKAGESDATRKAGSVMECWNK